MFSKEELYKMTSEQVYEAILNGKIDAVQFDLWVVELLYINRDEAYNNGYDSGYESAQYVYEYR
jgi:hypothetical protein